MAKYLRKLSLAANRWAERAEKPSYNMGCANETTKGFPKLENTSATCMNDQNPTNATVTWHLNAFAFRYRPCGEGCSGAEGAGKIISNAKLALKYSSGNFHGENQLDGWQVLYGSAADKREVYFLHRCSLGSKALVNENGFSSSATPCFYSRSFPSSSFHNQP